MLLSARKRQSTTMSFVPLSTFIIVVNLNACMSGAENPGDVSETESQDPNAKFENTGNAGSIVNLNGDASAFDLITFADSEVQNALNTQNQMDILAITTDTYYCNSPDPFFIDAGNGSITNTFVDEDPPGQSTNDSYSTTYDNCNQVTRTMDGFSRFTVNEQTGIPYQPGTAWTISTTSATNLTITFLNGEQMMDTSFTYSNGTIDGTVFVRTVVGSSIQSMIFDGVENSSAATYDVTIETNNATGAYTRNINISRSGNFGTRTTQTLLPLMGAGGPPDTGVLQLTITTPDGVTSIGTYTGIGGGNVLAEIDSDNDGVIDITQQTTWAGMPYY